MSAHTRRPAPAPDARGLRPGRPAREALKGVAYPVTLAPDPEDGGFVVTFPDLPEAVTQGETVAEALEEARG